MMYSKVIEVIEKDKSLKETEEFVYKSDKYTVKLIFSHGPHCKKVEVWKIGRSFEPVIVINDLEKLRQVFYMGKLDLNITRGLL